MVLNAECRSDDWDWASYSLELSAAEGPRVGEPVLCLSRTFGRGEKAKSKSVRRSSGSTTAQRSEGFGFDPPTTYVNPPPVPSFTVRDPDKYAALRPQGLFSWLRTVLYEPIAFRFRWPSTEVW